MSYVIVSVPSQRTRDRLTEIFMSSPVSINFDKFYIPLWYGEDGAPQVKAFTPNGPYSSGFVHFRTAMSPTHNASELSGELDSSQLRQRAQELGMPDDFPIRLVFLDHAPPISSTNKSFLVSISDTLVMYEKEPFTFEKDMLIKI